MRDDIGNKLVHLSKGSSNDLTKHRGEALLNLEKILIDRKLRGGTGFIKGQHTCICFSEAPLSKLSHLLALNDPKGFKYQPYGILVDKKWLFKQGGRPAIYGPDSDYHLLPPSMQYRHVRFDLSGQFDVDLTWEREWRLQAPALQLDPDVVTVVVADRVAKDAFIDEGHTDWHYLCLSDLGVDVDAI